MKYILLIDQNVFQALPLADYCNVLSHGEDIAEGEARELWSSDLIRFVYLGKTIAD